MLSECIFEPIIENESLLFDFDIFSLNLENVIESPYINLRFIFCQ
jgi:hypothetical protein